MKTLKQNPLFKSKEDIELFPIYFSKARVFLYSESKQTIDLCPAVSRSLKALTIAAEYINGPAKEAKELHT